MIADNAPSAIKVNEMKAFFGRTVAIDASMCLYQFLIAVRQDGSQLQSEDGETTSHLMGMLNRTVRMFENGVKPVYVFDGKPPDMKGGELEKRSERRAEAEKALTEAKEKGDVKEAEKFERRLVKVTKQQNDEAKRLLGLMGIPVVEAPCEAEAQCAHLVKAGKVFGTVTEDMDALTFGSTVLLRHFLAPVAKKIPIKEFNLSLALEEMKLSVEEFIDLCILLGCDYCGTIRGVGPKKAVELIRQHKNIETILENIDQNKYPPPEDWPYKRARELFLNPEVTKPEEVELTWKEADVEGVIQFLCGEKNFNEERIRNALAKLKTSRKSGTQGRIDSFFGNSTKVTCVTAATKRKAEEAEKAKKGAKKGGPPKKRAK